MISPIFFSITKQIRKRRQWTCCPWLCWDWESCWQNPLPSIHSWASSWSFSEVRKHSVICRNTGGKGQEWPPGFRYFSASTDDDTCSSAPCSFKQLLKVSWEKTIMTKTKNKIKTHPHRSFETTKKTTPFCNQSSVLGVWPPNFLCNKLALPEQLGHYQKCLKDLIAFFKC